MTGWTVLLLLESRQAQEAPASSPVQGSVPGLTLTKRLPDSDSSAPRT